MTLTVKRVKAMTMPELSLMSGDVRNQISHIDNKFTEHGESSAIAIADWLQCDPANSMVNGIFDVGALTHYLSEHFLTRTPTFDYPKRSLAESQYLSELNLPSPVIVMRRGFREFLSILLELSTICYDNKQFRTIAVGSVPDNTGSHVIYPDPNEVQAQLRNIFDFLSRTYSLSFSFCAIVLHNAICNIHPFIDGNGRVARMCFNWITSHATDNCIYYPLYELGVVSRGGFLLRMREAQYFSRWHPLLSFYESIAASLVI